MWNATATLEFAHFVSSGITKISQQAEFTNSSQLRASETKYMLLEAKLAETAEKLKSKSELHANSQRELKSKTELYDSSQRDLKSSVKANAALEKEKVELNNCLLQERTTLSMAKENNATQVRDIATQLQAAIDEKNSLQAKINTMEVNYRDVQTQLERAKQDGHATQILLEGSETSVKKCSEDNQALQVSSNVPKRYCLCFTHSLFSGSNCSICGFGCLAGREDYLWPHRPP